MVCKFNRVALSIVFLLCSIALFSADFQEIKMGPLLHLEENDTGNDLWKVSALYVLPAKSGVDHPKLSFRDDKGVSVEGQILGTKFGFDFVKYRMNIRRGEMNKLIGYQLDGERNNHAFVAPSKTQEVNFLYHSCNGYQYTQDRLSVKGIQPMWRKILGDHKNTPFHVQIGGGDQLYADGLIDPDGGSEPAIGDIHGVFALPSLQPWLDQRKDHDAVFSFAFSKTMKAEVDRFYFDHYVRQYNDSPEFMEVAASVPAVNQWDDHDSYDGKGSYPGYLQNSKVMRGITSFAGWYYFIVQQQLHEGDIPKAQGLNYVHTFGEVSILGIDTRSERTENQIVSPNSWEKIFASLEMLPSNVKHLVVMLSVPVVYASTSKLDSLFKVADNSILLGSALSLIPGMKNSFGTWELADDGGDGWGHPAHVEERNAMIRKFQDFAEQTGIRVTFLSGDVHVGGAGKIYSKECGISDWSDRAICQIVSSPVGNVTPSKMACKLICREAQTEQLVSDECAMCMFNFGEMSPKYAPLLRGRNFTTLKMSPHSKELDVGWSVELNGPDGEHSKFNLSIPSGSRVH